MILGLGDRLITNTIKFRKPIKLGVASEPCVRQDVFCLQ